jgi:hypothetical protein
MFTFKKRGPSVYLLDWGRYSDEPMPMLIVGVVEGKSNTCRGRFPYDPEWWNEQNDDTQLMTGGNEILPDYQDAIKKALALYNSLGLPAAPKKFKTGFEAKQRIL